MHQTAIGLVKFTAMIIKYFKKTVFGRMFGHKRGIEMIVWSKTDEFHNASHAANFVTVNLRCVIPVVCLNYKVG